MREEEGGYIVPKIWARDGERVAKEEIKKRNALKLPLGNWPNYLRGFQRIKKIKENTVTLGFNELPVGLPPTKYQRAKLNGFDITDKLLCVDGTIGDMSSQKFGDKASREPSLAWLTFKDGLVVVCQRVFVEKIE